MPTRSLDPRYAAIYAAIKRIPRGRVCSYGKLATLAGLPRRARLVGTALRLSPTSLKLPWHRVVTASGRIAFPLGSDHYHEQCRRLQSEGVTVTRQHVNMNHYAWPDRSVDLDQLLWCPPER
jgi:methylated-DNA-protein-cysteine methyltransferase related protein